MRPYGNILMGKKTRMRKAIRGMLDKNPSLEKILPHIQQNVGFVFAKNDLNEVRELIVKHKVKAPARPGAIAPCEVTTPPPQEEHQRRDEGPSWQVQRSPVLSG